MIDCASVCGCEWKRKSTIDNGYGEPNAHEGNKSENTRKGERENCITQSSPGIYKYHIQCLFKSITKLTDGMILWEMCLILFWLVINEEWVIRRAIS